MKVLLLSLNFAPELTGIGKYSGEMADHLVDGGHEVAVVCAPPYYPDWRVQPGWSSWRYRVERPRPGMTVYRCPLWVPRRPSGPKRLLHLFSFSVSILPVLALLVAWRPATVLTVAPAFFCAPAGWLAARLAGARAWLHIQDFELDAAFELGVLRGEFTRRLFAAAERRMMRSFDTVSTISRRMMRLLAAKGVAMERSELFPNWVDLADIRPLPGRSALRAELGLRDDQVVFLYSGTMNRKQGLPMLVAALERVAEDVRDRVALVMCGRGEMRSALQGQAAGRSNVRVLDLQPADRLNELLNVADVHLLPQLAGAADLVMPSKLGGMMASGRAVIAGAAEGTEIANTVRGCGRIVPPEDVLAMAQAMTELARSHDERRRLGDNARAFAEQRFGRQAVLGWLDGELARGRAVTVGAGAAAAAAARRSGVSAG